MFVSRGCLCGVKALKWRSGFASESGASEAQGWE